MIRDDVSVTTHTTAKYPTPRRCSPSMNEIPEASNPEGSSFSNKTPPSPSRPKKTSLFLPECHRAEPKLSKFLNGNNENPLTIGMSTASLFRPINIDNTVESKTEVKHSDKNFAKPETTVANTPDRFALSDTSFAAVDEFTVNDQQLKTENDSIQPLYFVSTQNKFQNHFPQENLNNQFQSKNMLSEVSRDIAEERFQTQTFQPKGVGCSKHQGTHNPRLTNPSSVKFYSQENPQNLDFDLQQTNNHLTKQHESARQNANNCQTANITFNPFGVQQTACSKTITESVPIALSVSTFPPQALPSVEHNYQIPSHNYHIHINFPAYYIQYQMKGSNILHLKSILYRGPQTELHIGRIQQVNIQ